MNRTCRSAFLALILVQAGHSIEEYLTRLYDVLGPARFVSGLIFDDLRVGFATFNVSLVAFGLWCFLGPVRHARESARALAWFWVVLELLNGLAHIFWAASVGAYRPGLATAPVLVAGAVILAWQLRQIPFASRQTVWGGRAAPRALRSEEAECANKPAPGGWA